MRNIVKAVVSIAIPQIVAGISAYFTITGVGSWYKTSVRKPSWNPPDWIFGPVWTTLYVMMGIALFLVWKSNADKAIKKQAIILWSVQLMFNFLWSIIFLNQHDIGWAFADIVVLWLFILLTIFSFARISLG